MAGLVGELIAEMDKMPAIDAHEHFDLEESLVAEHADVFTRLYVSYVIGSVVSAGWPGDRNQLTDTSTPLAERWRLLGPWVEAIKDTGVAWAAHIAARDLFGVDEINADTIELLSERLAAGNTPGFFERILRGRCNFQTALNVSSWDGVDGSLVRCVYNVWWDLWNVDAAAFRTLYEDWRDLLGTDFADARSMTDRMLQHVSDRGCVGLKFCAGLPAETIPDREAEAIFRKFKHGEFDSHESRALGTWMVHRLFASVPEHDMAVAFHCGVGSSDWEDPLLYKATSLIPILMKYRETRFDLYHASQPWVREAGILGHKFPNAHLNLVWAHQMSPFTVEHMLNEWIDLVPVNKIVGFGGDNGAPELTYGAYQIAKENIARALAQRIEHGRMGESRALDVCRAWLHDNPKRIYRL